jgi:hypothetical protein
MGRNRLLLGKNKIEPWGLPFFGTLETQYLSLTELKMSSAVTATVSSTILAPIAFADPSTIPANKPSYITDAEAADRALMEVLCAEYQKVGEEYNKLVDEYNEQDSYIRSLYPGWEDPVKGELDDYAILYGIEREMKGLQEQLDILEIKIEKQQDIIHERYEMEGAWLDGDDVECHDCGHDQMIKNCMGCSYTICAGCHFLCHDCKWGEYA